MVSARGEGAERGYGGLALGQTGRCGALLAQPKKKVRCNPSKCV